MKRNELRAARPELTFFLMISFFEPKLKLKQKYLPNLLKFLSHRQLDCSLLSFMLSISLQTPKVP
jgi:hypothetical protein